MKIEAKTVLGDGTKRIGRAKRMGIPKPLKAIRLKCLDCSNDQPSEVAGCPIKNCALWVYRMGRYPKATP